MDLRKMDILIAEKILGWRDIGPEYEGDVSSDESGLPKVLTGIDPTSRRRGYRHYLPRYSSEKWAARAVLSALKRAGWKVEFTRLRGDEGIWSCTLRRFGPSGEITTVSAEDNSGALAICRAALMTLPSEDSAEGSCLAVTPAVHARNEGKGEKDDVES